MTGGLTWGLAGYGDLAEKRLIEALSTPPHRLVAVWGRERKRAEQFAERFKIPRAAGSLEELVRGVDAVYVAVPPVAHVPVALTAVQAGRHVLIEKPLCPTFSDYDALTKAVVEKRVTAAVAYYRRFAPAVDRLRDIMRKGELGHIRSAEVTFARTYNPASNDAKAWRLDPAISGGGVLADVGCHRLDLLCWLLGPGRVRHAISDRDALTQIERVVDITMDFEQGGTAQCRFSWNDPFADRFVIQGERGSATLDPLDKGRLVVEIGHQQTIFDLPPAANLHIDLVRAFGRAIEGEPTSLCSLPEARQVDELLEAAYLIPSSQ